MVDYKESEHGPAQTGPAPDQQQPELEVDVATGKSSKSPAFQFYPKDFLSSSKVGRMSLTERGAYITLLSICWLDGGLQNDIAVLARLVGMKRAQFERVWAQGPLQECFYQKDGKLQNKRLDVERKAQADFRRKQKDRADQRWHPKPTGNAAAMPSVAEERQPSGNALRSPICNLQSAISEVRTPLPPNDASMDVWFEDLKATYPPSAVSAGHLTMTAFVDAILSQGTPLATFTVMLANLENQKRGHQWRVKNMIPRLDRWLREGLWQQQHDEMPPSTLVNEKTARTLLSGSAFVAGGDK